MIPRATYRLQFHRGFTFADGAGIARYLAQLGISHVYASPIQTARKGSTHGYDVVDHATINPELGGEAGFAAMVDALRANGLGLILDIVPNHMFVGDATNAWWFDVLENGEASRFPHHFDIDWRPSDPRLSGKVLIPFLGEPYEEALSSGAVKLVFDPALRKLVFVYHAHRFPLRPDDVAHVIGGNAPAGADLSSWNTPERLHALLERQHFALAWWRTAGDRINWRRFFEINELAGIRVEQDDVFEAVHALPLRLFREGRIDGLRIDHVDGLADPRGYCRKLRARLDDVAKQGKTASAPAYLVVEKILADDETLPRDWGVDGTTGYDFLAQVSALQHDGEGEVPLKHLWQRLSGRSGEFDEEARLGRDDVLRGFEVQVSETALAFASSAGHRARPHDLSTPLLRRVLIQLLSELRIYRTYARGAPGNPLPTQFTQAITRLSRSEVPEERAALDFVGRVMAGTSDASPEVASDAARRLNQLSSAVAAKGVEDTAFYRHAVLISRNDVGSDPALFAIAPSQFHAHCEMRACDFPHAMLATATHDTKRGEDARARLAVLSEVSAAWESAVASWFTLTRPMRGEAVEDAEVYHLLQTLVGAWPCTLATGARAGLAELTARVQRWRIKSLREAKLKTSWTLVDEGYEAEHTTFVADILNPDRSHGFLESFDAFVKTIAPAGASNTLVQTALRLTVPGVPDTYQGTEFWDHALVDPDNRQPVDFDFRSRALEQNSEPSSLVRDWRDGRVKQALIARLLRHRAATPDVYENGRYMRLRATGRRTHNIIAFARCGMKDFTIVVAARCCADALAGTDDLTPHAAWWGDTRIDLDELAGCFTKNLLAAGTSLSLPEELPVPGVLVALPVAVLAGRVDDRGGGE